MAGPPAEETGCFGCSPQALDPHGTETALAKVTNDATASDGGLVSGLVSGPVSGPVLLDLGAAFNENVQLEAGAGYWVKGQS